LELKISKLTARNNTVVGMCSRRGDCSYVCYL